MKNLFVVRLDLEANNRKLEDIIKQKETKFFRLRKQIDKHYKVGDMRSHIV